MGAMDDKDAYLAISLLSNGRLEHVDSGHAVHIEDPEIFIRIMLDFRNELQSTGK